MTPTLTTTVPAHPPVTGRRLAALVWAAGYAAALAAANLASSRYGLVPAGFGLTVTAGTYTAGLALALRDGLHETAGVPGVFAALAAGITVSALTANPQVVLASTAVATVGELADLAAYTPLRRRRRRAAVAVSGVVGGLVDTVGFLWLAGFPVTSQSVGGQLLVKAVWVTAPYLLLHEGVRRALPRQRQLTSRA